MTDGIHEGKDDGETLVVKATIAKPKTLTEKARFNLEAARAALKRAEALTKIVTEKSPMAREAWRDFGAALLAQRELVRSNGAFHEWVERNGLASGLAKTSATRSNAMWLAKHWKNVLAAAKKNVALRDVHHPTSIRQICRDADCWWAIARPRGVPSSNPRRLSASTAAVQAQPASENQSKRASLPMEKSDSNVIQIGPQLVLSRMRALSEVLVDLPALGRSADERVRGELIAEMNGLAVRLHSLRYVLQPRDEDDRDGERREQQQEETEVPEGAAPLSRSPNETPTTVRP